MPGTSFSLGAVCIQPIQIMAQARWTNPPEGGQGLLASQGDPAEAPELIEEAFDLITLLVEAPVDRRHDGTAGIGLDLCARPKAIRDETAERVGIAGGVGNGVDDTLQSCQKRLGLRTVA